jgi:CheY-like chemotaxis protein
MFSFTANEFARIGDGARRVEDQALSHEREAHALLAAAEANAQLAMAPLSQAREVTEACVDRFEVAALAQLRRSEAAVATARHLCAAAREHRYATHQLLSDLGYGAVAAAPAPDAAARHAVLVVDDLEDSRDLLSAVLHGAGFVVRTAGNGLEAIIAAYEMRPAVILMDVSMPVLDGVEATRLIKTIDAIRDARVIAYTANPLPTVPRHGALFAAVLQKPAPLDVVIATVRQFADA